MWIEIWICSEARIIVRETRVIQQKIALLEIVAHSGDISLGRVHE